MTTRVERQVGKKRKGIVEAGPSSAGRVVERKGPKEKGVRREEDYRVAAISEARQEIGRLRTRQAMVLGQLEAAEEVWRALLMDGEEEEEEGDEYEE